MEQVESDFIQAVKDGRQQYIEEERLKEILRRKNEEVRFSADGFFYFLKNIILVLGMILVCASIGHSAEIDMAKISLIESSGNPLAHRKSDDSRGLFQITPICLKEYNNFHPKAGYSMEDLWNTSISKKIADWYMNVRIPQLLRHYGHPDTVPNRIIAYNAGIKRVGNKLPKTTIAYLKKYASK